MSKKWPIGTMVAYKHLPGPKYRIDGYSLEKNSGNIICKLSSVRTGKFVGWDYLYVINNPSEYAIDKDSVVREQLNEVLNELD